MRRAASIKALCELKDITPDLARQIRAVWKENDRAKLSTLAEKHGVTLHHGYAESRNYLRALIIDRIGRFHGVEHMGTHRRTRLDVDYCNAGDTYAGTIVFHGNALHVSTVGDWIESGAVRESRRF